MISLMLFIFLVLYKFTMLTALVNDAFKFYYNSPYKKESTNVITIKYTSDQSNESMHDNSVSDISSINNTTTYTAPENIASIGDVVVVRCNIKKKTLTYLGVIQDINSEQHKIQFLKRSG